MQELMELVKSGPDLLPFSPAASVAADELMVNVRAKKASWLSVVADRRSAGGVQITIDCDGERVVAEVIVEETTMKDEVREIRTPRGEDVPSRRA